MRVTLSSALIGLVASAAAPAQTFDFPTPTDDRWQYPFNFTPGSRVVAGCFSSLGTGNPDFQDFNDRDGVLIIAWDTSGLIPPGQDPGAYNIQSVTITVTNEDGAQWAVDLTPDEWFTYDVNNDGVVNGDGVPRGAPGDTDGESDDPDPGRALELFGVGFGPTFTPATWNEFSFYVGGMDGSPAPRDPFPFVFDPNGAMLHVEDNVDGLWNEALGVTRFTPTPWAVGVPVGYDPNDPNALDRSVPFDIRFEVDLTLSGGRVREYFQNQLNDGRVFVVITSLAETVQQGSPTGFPNLFTKEAVGLVPGAKAPRLEIVLAPNVPGDVNGDGCVNLDDLTLLLVSFGATGSNPADLNGDGVVDLDDLTIVLQFFDQGNCP